MILSDRQAVDSARTRRLRRMPRAFSGNTRCFRSLAQVSAENNQRVDSARTRRLRRIKSGFTLIELLVATTLFVTLMGIVTVSFNRLSNASNKALQILNLNTKADAIQRQLEADIRAMLPVAALHLQVEAAPYTLTFMRQVKDLHPSHFRNTTLESGVNPFESRFFKMHRISDTAWIRYRWGEGAIERGLSRVNEIALTALENNGMDYTCNTEKYLWEPIFTTRPSTGVHANAITPMVQRHYEYFEGKGATIATVGSDGGAAAAAAGKIAVYKNATSTLYLGKKTGWGVPAGPLVWEQEPYDYRHLYTTLSTGNEDQLSDPDVSGDGIPDDGVNDAYAVRNSDGQSLNKDRLNLLGATDDDGDGNLLYPSQMKPLFDGIEYMHFELIGRDGDIIGAGDETDRLGDGADSLDISGVDPSTGEGYARRPIGVRVSFLLHSINQGVLDDEDCDGDGDIEETLSVAIRHAVALQGLATRREEIAAYEKIALKYGYSSIYFVQGIQVGQ